MELDDSYYIMQCNNLQSEMTCEGPTAFVQKYKYKYSVD